MDFDTIATKTFNLIPDKRYIIVISYEQSCHFAKYFAHKYSKRDPKYVKGLFILGDRKLSKANYLKVKNQAYFQSLKTIFKDQWPDYIDTHMTDDRLTAILDELKRTQDKDIKKDLITFLNGFVKLSIRSQYKQVPYTVRTNIYTYNANRNKAHEQITKESKVKVKYHYYDEDTTHTRACAKYIAKANNTNHYHNWAIWCW